MNSLKGPNLAQHKKKACFYVLLQALPK